MRTLIWLLVMVGPVLAQGIGNGPTGMWEVHPLVAPNTTHYWIMGRLQTPNDPVYGPFMSSESCVASLRAAHLDNGYACVSLSRVD